jgi:hypothetical protein
MWLAISTIIILLWPVGTWAYDRIKNGSNGHAPVHH